MCKRQSATPRLGRDATYVDQLTFKRYVSFSTYNGYFEKGLFKTGVVQIASTASRSSKVYSIAIDHVA